MEYKSDLSRIRNSIHRSISRDPNRQNRTNKRNQQKSLSPERNVKLPSLPKNTVMHHTLNMNFLQQKNRPMSTFNNAQIRQHSIFSIYEEFKGCESIQRPPTRNDCLL